MAKVVVNNVDFADVKATNNEAPIIILVGGHNIAQTSLIKIILAVLLIILVTGGVIVGILYGVHVLPQQVNKQFQLL